MTITIHEYKFEVDDNNNVKVFDTSLNEYVGAFESPEEVVTKEICEEWLEAFYEW